MSARGRGEGKQGKGTHCVDRLFMTRGVKSIVEGWSLWAHVEVGGGQGGEVKRSNFPGERQNGSGGGANRAHNRPHVGGKNELLGG